VIHFVQRASLNFTHTLSKKYQNPRKKGGGGRDMCQKEVIAHQKLTKWCFDKAKLAAEAFGAYGLHIQII